MLHSHHRQRAAAQANVAKRLCRFLIPALVLLCLCYPLRSQNREHLIGVRYGYAANGVHYNPNVNQESVTSPINASVLYTYYHDLWGKMPIFGFQTGLSYTHHGFKLYDGVYNYDVVRLPLTSQFHVNFWKMRLLLNLGFFGGYRLQAEKEYDLGETHYVEAIKFDCCDKRWDYGFAGGAGIAFKFKPFELQLEANYEYSLNMLYNPRKNSNESYIYVYPWGLTFSAALFIHL